MEEKLRLLLNNSYSPYSQFRVSAVAVMNDGKMFEGVNVENAAYASTCAERSAIVSAVSAGYKKEEFKELHVMVDSPKISTCCFVCRQLISEFFAENAPIFCYNRNGEVKRFTVAELCPYPFDAEDLN